jgi:hypothetical protein
VPVGCKRRRAITTIFSDCRRAGTFGPIVGVDCAPVAFEGQKGGRNVCVGQAKPHPLAAAPDFLPGRLGFAAQPVKAGMADRLRLESRAAANRRDASPGVRSLTQAAPFSDAAAKTRPVEKFCQELS